MLDRTKISIDVRSPRLPPVHCDMYVDSGNVRDEIQYISNALDDMKHDVVRHLMLGTADSRVVTAVKALKKIPPPQLRKCLLQNATSFRLLPEDEIQRLPHEYQNFARHLNNEVFNLSFTDAFPPSPPPEIPPDF